MQQVTYQELEQLGIKVELGEYEVIEWAKHIALTYEGISYSAKLRWDTYSGYELTWEDDAPATLKELSDRPEFEYILDSLTEKESANA